MEPLGAYPGRVALVSNSQLELLELMRYDAAIDPEYPWAQCTAGGYREARVLPCVRRRGVHHWYAVLCPREECGI